MPDYGKDIAKAKLKVLDALNARKEEMGGVAHAIILQTIEETFDINNAEIQNNKDFIEQLDKLTMSILDLIHTDIKFTGPVSRFIKRMPPISDVTAYETSKKIFIDEIIGKMLNNGLNQHFVQLLRDLIYQNVSDGLSQSDAQAQIEEYIESGKDKSGELAQYIEETAIQAVSAYSRMINTKMMEEFDFDGLLITGSLIDISSPQCRYAIEELGGTIKRTDWPKLKEIAEKNGLIEGTTFDNLPFNLLHRYCRHDFCPILLKKPS